MEPFTHYHINETEQGIEVVLYLDQQLTEFSDELGTRPKVDEPDIKKEAQSFIQRKFPSLKVKSVKIMAGAILLTTLGIGTLSIDQASASAATSPTQSQTISTSYIVSPGDTLFSIASRNGTTVDAIKQANQLSTNTLSIGQRLIIPNGNGATTAPTQQSTTTHTVASGDTLFSIASRNGTTVDAIKQANQLTSNTLSIGQTLTIPNGSGTTTAPTQQSTTTHRVTSGDTLFSIASRNGTTVDVIKQANQLSSNTLSIGQTLTIPNGSGSTTAPIQQSTTNHTVASGDTLFSIASRNGTTVDAIKQANQLSSNTLSIGQTLTIPSGSGPSIAPIQQSTTNHTVTSGDTLFIIASQNGTTVDAIKQANQLTSNTLSIGQTLTIPNGSGATSAPTAPSTNTKVEQQSEFNQEEVEWLAKMIYSEARGESLQGQIAVGAVIMNRVKSPLFPNNVKDVLFEKSYGYYQFTPAETGSINTAKSTAQHMDAAQRAMSGEDPTNGTLFFYNPNKTSSPYLMSRTVSTVIGNHTFAY